MTKHTAIIIDDERLARVNLKRLLESYSEIEVVAEAGSCASAIKAIKTFKPGVVFLDIQLMGETGFDLLEKIGPYRKIVFVTAYNEYAIRAFEINAIDYLLKPVNPLRLAETIKRLNKSIDPMPDAGKKFNYNDAVYLKLNSHTSGFLKINTIEVITSVGNHTKLKAADGKHFIVLKTLKQWEEELPAGYFVRIHRSTIINIEFILRIEKYSMKYFRLYAKNIDDPFKVSRRYLNGLKKKYRI